MKFFYKLGTTENLSSHDSVCLRMAVNFVLCFNTLNCEYILEADCHPSGLLNLEPFCREKVRNWTKRECL